jgi:HAD superfamily hydrolase (TIGR01490 family)
MKLSLFDLDGTIISGDSAFLFLDILEERGIIDSEYRKNENELIEQFFLGNLNILDCYKFFLQPIIGMTNDNLQDIFDDFITNKIKPCLNQQIIKIIEKKIQAGEIVVVVSATLDFLVDVIAKELNIKHVLASNIIYDKDNKITGEVDLNICHQEGKVKRIKEFCQKHNIDLTDSEAYGDSVNDIPMLELASKAFVVSPKGKMLEYAIKHNLKILNFD